MYMNNSNKEKERESEGQKNFGIGCLVQTCLQKENKMHAKDNTSQVDPKICSEVKSLPDGWDLLLHHHVC